MAAVTVRPFASNLLDPGCDIPACDGKATFAISEMRHDTFIRHACDAHVGDVTANTVKPPRAAPGVTAESIEQGLREAAEKGA